MKAAALGCTVRIEYDGGSRGNAPRLVTPRDFVQRGGYNYMVAYCHLDSMEKSFRLDRIRRFDLVPTARPESAAVDCPIPSR